MVSGARAPGGPWSHAAHLAEGLAARGITSELVVVAQPGVPLPRTERATLRVLPAAGGSGEPDDLAERDVNGLARVLSSDAPVDILHAEDAVAGRAARLAGRATALVLTVHHLEATTSDAMEELQRAAIQDADACVTATAYWAERIATLFGVEADVIPNGVDSAFGACALSRGEARTGFGWGPGPIVLGLGGIARRKGTRLLLEAFARGRPGLGPEALLVVLGPTDGPSADTYVRGFHDDAERLGLHVGAPGPAPSGPSVQLLGSLAAEHMPALFRAVDLVAVPSTREGSPLVVLEAAAAGRPAVVSDLPSLRESLVADEDVVMVPTGHAGALADAMVRLISEPRLADALVSGAARRARAATWDAAVVAHLALYRRLLAGG